MRKMFIKLLRISIGIAPTKWSFVIASLFNEFLFDVLIITFDCVGRIGNCLAFSASIYPAEMNKIKCHFCKEIYRWRCLEKRPRDKCECF